LESFGPLSIIPGLYSAEWRMYRSCTLVISARGECAVIDPASDEQQLAQLAPKATLCINSHPHADHILYNPMFLHVPLFAPVGDAHFYDPQDLSELGPEAESLIGGHVRRRSSRAIRKPDRLLDDGEVLDIGGVEIRTVNTPGHTPGLLCLHFPQQRAVYIADYDLTDFGPWYGNQSSDPDEFIASAERIRALDVDHYITSHEAGVVTRDQLEPLLTKFLAHVDRRDQKIVDLMNDGPRSFDELTTGGVVYSERAVSRSPWMRMWERQHIRKHVARLSRRSVISDTGDGRWQKK
jgi:hydroxyacylglutathione hydrolase